MPRYEGEVVTYIHGGGRIGVMVGFETDLADKAEFKDYAKDIAMQVAASAPTYLDKASVPSETIEKEKEILTVQAINEGKPANIAEKMVMGRISKYYKEVCLLEQPFIKDGGSVCDPVHREGGQELAAASKSPALSVMRRARAWRKKRTTSRMKLPSMIK